MQLYRWTKGALFNRPSLILAIDPYRILYKSTNGASMIGSVLQAEGTCRSKRITSRTLSVCP